MRRKRGYRNISIGSNEAYMMEQPGFGEQLGCYRDSKCLEAGGLDMSFLLET
jgi:hypothetical protein